MLPNDKKHMPSMTLEIKLMSLQADAWLPRQCDQVCL